MMKTRKLMLIILTAIFLSACGSNAEAVPTIDSNMLMTEVAATIIAENTQAALLTPSATMPPPPTATTLPLPTQPIPSTPSTANPAALPTVPGGISPDNATWIADVTVPDGTVFWQGERFTKTWRIENSGTTTWDSGYTLIFWDSFPTGFYDFVDEEYRAVSITNVVEPTNQIEISIRMAAPDTLGKYQFYWKLVNEDGQTFGDTLYVDFVVGTTADKTPTPSG